MSESGIAVDPASKTVLLIGADAIHRIFQRTSSRFNLNDFNKIAQTIVYNQGAAYGAYLDGITDDEWCLGTITQEDSLVLTSYLEDPSAEVAAGRIEFALVPNVETNKCLH